MSNELPFEQLKTDIESALKRIKEVKYVEAKKEASDWIYPLMLSIVEAMDERLAEVEEVVAEFVNPSESVVLPDLAQRILGILGIGQRLAAIAQLLASNPNLDDEAKAKISQVLEGNGTVEQWAATFLTESQALAVELQEVTVEDEDEEDEEVEDGEVVEDDGEEEEEEEETE